jgi:hypothetical protein
MREWLAACCHRGMSIRFWPILLMLSASASAADPPLTVSQLVTGASSRVRVTNNGSQAITAWSLAAISTTGERTHREVYTADGYLSEITHGLPGSSDLLDRLGPGEARELPLDPLPEGSTVEVVAIVFDDGSAAGDEGIVQSIFARRAKERDALEAVVSAFNEVLATEHGTAALDALGGRLRAVLQAEETVPCRAALDAVASYARTTDPAQIDQSLKTYQGFVAREYALAKKHSQRR